MYEDLASGSRARRTLTGAARVLFALQLDGPLVAGLALIAAFGLVVLYSASGQSVGTVVRTALRLLLGTVAMLLLARVNPNFLRRSTPWLYVAGCGLLLIVAAIGHVGMGAQRWLNLGLFRFQPSELMKLAVPMTCAWYLHERPLPPGWGSLAMLTVLILIPVGLVAIEPDLGTASFMSSEGWKRNSPRSSQRCAPRPTWPIAATITSSTQPPKYSQGVMRRRKFGLMRASSSIAIVPISRRTPVRTTVGTLCPEALYRITSP